MTNQHNNDDQGQYDRQDPSPLLVALSGVALLAFLFTIGAIGKSLFRVTMGEAWQEEVGDQPNTQRDDMRTAATKQLQSYGMVNAEQKIVHIPIAQAMELTISDLAQGKDTGAVAPAPTKKTASKTSASKSTAGKSEGSSPK